MQKVNHNKKQSLSHIPSPGKEMHCRSSSLHRRSVSQPESRALTYSRKLLAKWSTYPPKGRAETEQILAHPCSESLFQKCRNNPRVH